MKKIFLLLLFSAFASQAQLQTITPTVSPNPFERNQQITITVQGSQINEATWGVTGNALYLWAWMQDANGNYIADCPTNGTWTASSEANRLTYNSGNDTYTITFVPQTFYNNTVFGRMGFLVKAKDGTNKQTNDNIFNVGAFQMSLVSPVENSFTILSASTNASIVASNTGGAASYVLKANGVTISGPTSTTFFTAGPLVSQNTVFTVECTQGATTIVKKFTYLFNPGTISQALPSGVADDGITYNSGDATKATLVLDAPNKDFVYVAGSFNNWFPTAAYAMKKDPTTGKFWLELTGLTSGQIYTYQYWVCKTTPTITNSPKVVKTADPYSTLVLSPFDDPYIPATKYPNLPAYPTGQEKEVTVLQTGQTPYNWTVTNFTKPAKENLVIYEVLVRDFDADRSYQSLIDRMDYFKNLKVNAIELMPVMEYEGNEGWGYNPSFHLAADKFYGPANKLKEFVDLCHQNGIAVVLDVALNHAFGRNPMVRMWMVDADGDGFGDPSSENPYFNTVATHSYGVGNDFNHSSARTKYYTKRVIKQWIQEFKIDGLRWDLTKGFTQNCTGSDACTNSYQQDRVDVLKEYADYSWSLDPTHYTIFEHLGVDSEEQQWANYRIAETPSKGVMLWGKMTDQYNQLTMGYNSSNDISRMSSSSRGFTNKRLVGYAESHDEERLMYKNVTFGSTVNAAHNVTNLNTALSRMSALGAVTLLVPGPKMIWGFGDLGNDESIFTCNNGTINTASDATSGDCRLDTKIQNQWTSNWLGNTNRSQIYNDWAKMIDLKKNNSVFSANSSITSGTTLQPKIYIWDDTLPTTTLKNVVVLSNFDVTAQNVVPNFPYTGTWYDLMTNTPISVSNASAPINIAAGQYKIYGNQPAALASNEFEMVSNLKLSPNPTSGLFTISGQVAKVQVYSITGQMVKSFENISSDNYPFDINDLSKGVYLVKAIDMNNNSKTLKLIKQ
ncbi:alpha-amylase family glycosyl hydrolase [Flavobacterium sp. N1994]|uniref:alpha-amylase family glycosyl hydrolase n=1 Tax=Flavobacterium sp. N1994 TaxID=2986827 RepID=UPI002222158A|nr:alpha-amylase family glycosyl hydrolase [Flavobacterium sp. N1994]